MFWFLLIALVAVVAAVTLAVVGGDDGVALPEAQPDRLDDPLPASRPVGRADLEALRLPMTVRGYRMSDVDDVLGRIGAELAERDARIAELEAALAGAQAAAIGTPELLKGHGAEEPGTGRAADAGPGTRNGSGPGTRTVVDDPEAGTDRAGGAHGSGASAGSGWEWDEEPT